jgi:hypothetical protein
MKRGVNNIWKSKLFKVFLLLFLWAFLTVWYIVTFDTSFSIWSYNHPNNDIKNLNYKLIDKGETFKGEFVAQDNNLGIIAVRFQTYIRPPYQYEDQFLFRLKEKGAKDWYYQNIYRSGLIYDVPFFPFGFPQISNSKGKTYDFEIASLNANSVNRISISKRYPILQSKYKYSKNELLHDKTTLAKFLLLKFTNAFKTPDVIFSSFTYLLPLLLYLSWISFLEKLLTPITQSSKRRLGKLEHSRFGIIIALPKKIFVYNFDSLLIIVVFFDILIFQVFNSMLYVIIALLWLSSSNLNKSQSRKTFILAMILIILCPAFLAVSLEPTAEKAASWAFIFLVVGLIQAMIELKKEESSVDRK